MSVGKKTGKKGLETEEIVRSYFLAAGFFVVRGIKLRIGGDDMTDIDLWLYERSATLARRRIIIDIKDNAQPKAAERLFFVKGLAEIIQVEATGVVTSDSRHSLRDIARQHNVIWIDNGDLQRLKTSQRLAVSTRISDEMLESLVARLDLSRSSREIRDVFHSVKYSVVDRFGPSCANTATEGAHFFSRMAIQSHPSSDAARTLVRLTYFCGAIASAAFDFVSGETALRPASERLASLTSAIRFGDDATGTAEKLRWSEAAIRDFAPNGASLAQVVRARFQEALQAIPAEDLAAIFVKMANSDRLFNVARELEQAAYVLSPPAFDGLSVDARSVLGAMLDFGGIDRALFAQSWHPPHGSAAPAEGALGADGANSEGIPPRRGQDDDRLL